MLHRHNPGNSRSMKKNFSIPCVKTPRGSKARINRAFRRANRVRIVSGNIDDFDDYTSSVTMVGNSYRKYGKEIELDEYLCWRTFMSAQRLSDMPIDEVYRLICKWQLRKERWKLIYLISIFLFA